ncbi:MAG: glycosyl hydrolase [Prolixibacteraceae bacterium]
MKNTKNRLYPANSNSLIVFAQFATALFLLCACTTKEASWPERTNTSKPWTRWWWPGNAVDSANLKREINELADAGIGGVEITPIYGVKGEEEKFIPFLSTEFTEMMEFTIKETEKNGMQVDMPPGSGWRCGGPFVPREKGLWNLEIKKRKVQKGENFVASLGDTTIAAVSFVPENGEVQVLQPGEQFTAISDGTVYNALRVKSPDRVKRADEGGQGWAIDTFDKEITEWYLSEFWKRLGISEGKLRCFFHDSFEYTGDFTPGFLQEFEKRRGYDLTQYLHVLAGDCKDAEAIARVKSDYRETLSDLVLESFIQPMTKWANKHGSLNRNQAHGSPGNILDLYAACDIPETEIFGRIEPGTVNVFVNKFASSAAHITGKKLVSSESFTWLGEHWTVTPADMVRATNRFFLSGVNHMFFHGTCYSPEDAEWPGWLFYASTQMNNRNPLWREMPALFQYIERSQSVLQKATPESDLLVYWPYYDVEAKQDGRLFFSTNINSGDKASWFSDYPLLALSEKMMDSGYAFDYISDKQLLNCQTIQGEIVTEGNAKYKAVVIPQTSYIPLKTMQKLVQFIDAGGKVYFDKALPKSVPGMNRLAERESQLEQLKKQIASNAGIGEVGDLLLQDEIRGEESLLKNGFHFLKMKMEDEMWYMIFNTGTKMKDARVKLNTPAKTYVFLNPMTGKISLPEQKVNAVRLQLEPEKSLFVKCSGDRINALQYVYQEKTGEPSEIEGEWNVEFIEGGPELPDSFAADKLESWTKQGGETARFAGTARYSVTFEWDEKSKAVLNLGDVKDCARVKLNGKDYGVLLGPVFKCNVNILNTGENMLEVEVTNIAANRIRDLDKRGADWKKFYDINFVNIDYEPFDASAWEIQPAGLLGPVELIPVSHNK